MGLDLFWGGTMNTEERLTLLEKQIDELTDDHIALQCKCQALKVATGVALQLICPLARIKIAEHLRDIEYNATVEYSRGLKAYFACFESLCREHLRGRQKAQAPGESLRKRRQRLPPHGVGRSLEQHLDLRVVAVGKFLGQPAARLEMEILQVVIRASPTRLCVLHLARRVALAALGDFGQVAEEEPRAVEQRNKRAVMVRGKRIRFRPRRWRGPLRATPPYRRPVPLDTRIGSRLSRRALTVPLPYPVREPTHGVGSAYRPCVATASTYRQRVSPDVRAGSYEQDWVFHSRAQRLRVEAMDSHHISCAFGAKGRGDSLSLKIGTWPTY